MAALWTPALLATAPIAWFDPAYGITLDVNGNNTVQSWASRVGSLVAAAVGSSQPLPSATGINGYPGVVSSVAEKYLDVPAFTHPGTYSMFAVLLRNIATSGTYNTIDAYTVGNIQAQYLRFSGTADLQSIAFNTGGTAYTVTATGLAPNTTSLVASLTRTATQVALGVNGGTPATLATTGTPTAVSSKLRLGAYLNASSNSSLRGAIGPVIFIDGVVDTPTQQKLEGFLAWSYGLQGNLPAAHPYKSRAPLASDP